MRVKALVLAAAVTAGLFCTANSADAQYRYRSGRSYSYVAPTYYAPTYTAPIYTPPTYNGVVGIGSYTPLGGTSMVVPGGYSSSYYNPTYSYPTYSNFSSGGVYVAPSGTWRGRGWRW